MNDIGFTSEDTRAVKGVAVVMMLLHHLAAYSDRFPVGFQGFRTNSGIEEVFLTSVAFGLNFCVAIFFFLGGYGMYKRMMKGSFSLTNSVFGLLERFWKVFVIFVPIALIFFDRTGDDISQLATRYNFSTIRELITTIIGNFTMLSTSINDEWWFLRAYISILLLGTVYAKVTKKLNFFAGELLLAFGLAILFRSVLPNLSSVQGFDGLAKDTLYCRLCSSETARAGSFFMGIIFAKYDVLVKLKRMLDGLPFKAAFGLVGAVAVVWCLCFVEWRTLESIYAPLFVASLSVFFDSVKPLRNIFSLIGKQSTNMWLIHSFYCYYFLEVTKLVYISSNVWIDLGILVSISFFTSIIVELLYSYLFKGINYIRCKLTE